jgi:hypothetical protein
MLGTTRKATLLMKKLWNKVRTWVISILVTLGLITVAVQAATVNFTYTPATTYTDGTLMPLEDIDFTRLYCDGVMVSEEPGADGDFSIVLGFGTHVCTATHVVLMADTPESDMSAPVTKVVSPGQPSPPTLD